MPAPRRTATGGHAARARIPRTWRMTTAAASDSAMKPSSSRHRVRAPLKRSACSGSGWPNIKHAWRAFAPNARGRARRSRTDRRTSLQRTGTGGSRARAGVTMSVCCTGCSFSSVVNRERPPVTFKMRKGTRGGPLWLGRANGWPYLTQGSPWAALAGTCARVVAASSNGLQRVAVSQRAVMALRDRCRIARRTLPSCSVGRESARSS
jgi:hypothetical protein